MPKTRLNCCLNRPRRWVHPLRLADRIGAQLGQELRVYLGQNVHCSGVTIPVESSNRVEYGSYAASTACSSVRKSLRPRRTVDRNNAELGVVLGGAALATAAAAWAFLAMYSAASGSLLSERPEHVAHVPLDHLGAGRARRVLHRTTTRSAVFCLSFLSSASSPSRRAVPEPAACSS